MSKNIILYKNKNEVNRYLELLNKKGVLIGENDSISIDAALKDVEDIRPDKIFIPIKEISPSRISLIEEILTSSVINKPDIIAITEIEEESFKGFVINEAFNRELPMNQRYNIEHVQKEVHLTRLPVNKDGIVFFIDYKIILYMTAQGKDTHIYTEEKIYTSEDSLKKMQNRLENSGFMKSHRSYIVNLNKIDKITYWNNGVHFISFKETDETIPVSRKYYKQLKQALQL